MTNIRHKNRKNQSQKLKKTSKTKASLLSDCLSVNYTPKYFFTNPQFFGVVEFIRDFNECEPPRNIHAKTALYTILKLRAFYSHGYISNYNSTSVSNYTGITKYILDTYMPFMIEQGWFYMKGNNLYFQNLDKLFNYTTGDGFRPFMKGRHYGFYFTKESGLMDFKDKLNEFLLRFNSCNQDLARQLKRNEHKSLNPYDEKTMDYVKQDGIALVDENFIGHRKIAAHLKCSTTTAGRFLRKLERKGVVATVPIIEYLGEVGDISQSYMSQSETKQIWGKKIGHIYQIADHAFCHKGTQIFWLKGTGHRLCNKVACEGYQYHDDETVIPNDKRVLSVDEQNYYDNVKRYEGYKLLVKDILMQDIHDWMFKQHQKEQETVEIPQEIEDVWYWTDSEGVEHREVVF